MYIEILPNPYKNVTNEASNVINTARIILRTPLDDDVPTALWSDSVSALTYLNQKHYNTKYELSPYHYIIDKEGKILQNRPPEMSDQDLLFGYLNDIEIFILASHISELQQRNFDNPYSITPSSSLANLVAFLSEKYNIILTDYERNINFVVSESSAFLINDNKQLLTNIIKSAIIYRNSENQLYSVCENILYPAPADTIYFESMPEGYYEFDVSYPFGQSKLFLRFTSLDNQIRFLYPGIDYNELKPQSSDDESNAVFFIKAIDEPGKLEIIIFDGEEKFYQNMLIRPILYTPHIDHIKRLCIGLKIDPVFFQEINGHINLNPEGVKIGATYNKVVLPNTVVGATYLDVLQPKIGIGEELPDGTIELLNTVNRISKRINSIVLFIPIDVLYNYYPYVEHISKECDNILTKISPYLII